MPDSAAVRLQAAAARVVELRRATAADPALAERTRVLKAWQAGRLARTHADLLAHPRYAQAARFFLDDLYGAKDFSQRDAELARLIPSLVRLLPDRALATIADAVELDALSEALDARVASALPPGPVDARGYAAAYRVAGTPDERSRQVHLVGHIGDALERLVRHPMLGRLLAAMGGPARLAGLQAMHEFLVRGFDAFRAMGGAGEFVRLVQGRERSVMERLLAGVDTGWDGAGQDGTEGASTGDPPAGIAGRGGSEVS